MRLERVFTHRLVRLMQFIIPILVIVLVAVPAWNYYVRHAQKPAPTKQGRQLPSDVSVHTEGLTFSQTEGGRTSYTVRAKTYLGVKDNKSMLEDADVIVYGSHPADPTRTIRGKHCNYDQETSDFDCNGAVEIQLDPRTVIHTEELVYNHRDGIATSPSHANLFQEGTTGEADRFEYGVNSGLLKLNGHVKFDTAEHTELQTESAIFQQKESWTTMSGGVYMQSPTSWIRGTSGRAELTPGTFKPKAVTVDGNVTGESHPQAGREAWKIRSAWLNAQISPAGEVEHLLTRGNAEIEKVAGDTHQRLTGAEIETSFNRDRKSTRLNSS